MNASFVASVLLTAACVLPIEEPMPENNCAAEDYQHFLGEPGSAVDAISSADTVRILRPGQTATMDYLPDRLNIELDHSDRISRLYCG